MSFDYANGITDLLVLFVCHVCRLGCKIMNTLRFGISRSHKSTPSTDTTNVLLGENVVLYNPIRRPDV